MVDLETEVCLSVVQGYLEKTEAQRSEKHTKLAMEAVKILEHKQEQFNEKDKELYQRALEGIVPSSEN